MSDWTAAVREGNVGDQLRVTVLEVLTDWPFGYDIAYSCIISYGNLNFLLHYSSSFIYKNCWNKRKIKRMNELFEW